MENYKKQVGRPAELDSNGDPIAKCLINCTIPTKLRDFLSKHKINRSELFRTAALKMYELKICPKCYSHNVRESQKGHICKDCKQWLKFKRCELCDAVHVPKSTLHAVNDKVGCDQCPEVILLMKDSKEIDVVFGNVL